MLAVDCSNWTGPLSAGSLQAWKTSGVGLVIVQSIDPPTGYPAGVTVQQIQAGLDAGLLVDAYVWLWFDATIDDIHRKTELLLPFAGALRQLWLDVEDTAARGYDTVVCEAKVAFALQVCDSVPVAGGRPTGIYTGRWFWEPTAYMGNSEAFKDRDLWDAHYDLNADPAAGFVPYGGWTSAAVKQYAGTSTLDSVGNVDLDSTVVLSVPQEHRQTPDDWPWPDWRRSAIAYRGALDSVVPEYAAYRTAHP